MTANRKPNRYQSITAGQTKDSGMALVLIFLIIGFLTGKSWTFSVATVFLVINMIWPGLYRPFAWFWYGLAQILGLISSNIILTLVYILLVIPVGLIRRALGKDKLMLKAFKKQPTSVFIHRNHQFEKKDIDQPF